MNESWAEMYNYEVPDRRELRLEAVLLGHVLDEFPAPLSLLNLANYLSHDPADPLEAEDVDRLARNLAATGLLYRVPLGPDEPPSALPVGNLLLLPTKAALHDRALVQESGLA
jgi:hypothetical protein